MARECPAKCTLERIYVRDLPRERCYLCFVNGLRRESFGFLLLSSVRTIISSRSLFVSLQRNDCTGVIIHVGEFRII